MNTRPSTAEDFAKWIGHSCTFVDPVAVNHAALITAVHGMNSDTDEPASVNLVFVSADDAKTDPYGRQIERQTSVVNKAAQYAHGMYFAV